MANSLEALDHIVINFNAAAVNTLNIALALIMFGVALGIKVADFKNLTRTPRPLLAGIISQFIGLPALTFLLVLIIRPTPTVALGMILVAACPGGNISNFMSALAKGNAALSVTLTAFATSAAVIMTPLNFAFWGRLYINFYEKADADALLRPLQIDTFQVFQTVFILLGIPLVLGLLFAYYFPLTTKKIVRPIRIASILIFMGIVIGAFAANWEHFTNVIHLIFLIVLVHNGLALFTGFSIASAFRVSRPNRRAITIETGIQNSGLALALMFNPKIFPPDLALGGMTIIAAWWGIWHIISGLTIAGLLAKKPIKDVLVPGFRSIFKPSTFKFW